MAVPSVFAGVRTLSLFLLWSTSLCFLQSTNRRASRKNDEFQTLNFWNVSHEQDMAGMLRQTRHNNSNNNTAFVITFIRTTPTHRVSIAAASPWLS